VRRREPSVVFVINYDNIISIIVAKIGYTKITQGSVFE